MRPGQPAKGRAPARRPCVRRGRGRRRGRRGGGGSRSGTTCTGQPTAAAAGRRRTGGGRAAVPSGRLVREVPDGGDLVGLGGGEFHHARRFQPGGRVPWAGRQMGARLPQQSEGLEVRPARRSGVAPARAAAASTTAFPDRRAAAPARPAYAPATPVRALFDGHLGGQHPHSGHPGGARRTRLDTVFGTVQEQPQQPVEPFVGALRRTARRPRRVRRPTPPGARRPTPPTDVRPPRHPTQLPRPARSAAPSAPPPPRPPRTPGRPQSGFGGSPSFEPSAC